MKTNKEQLKAAMDRRLSFLDDVPSCRAKVMYRIAQKEEPVVMKKKLSVGLVLALVLAMVSMSALAAGLLLSAKVSASRLADQELHHSFALFRRQRSFLLAVKPQPHGGPFSDLPLGFPLEDLEERVRVLQV